MAVRIPFLLSYMIQYGSVTGYFPICPHFFERIKHERVEPVKHPHDTADEAAGEITPLIMAQLVIKYIGKFSFRKDREKLFRKYDDREEDPECHGVSVVSESTKRMFLRIPNSSLHWRKGALYPYF